jgi:hypothetical protein
MSADESHDSTYTLGDFLKSKTVTEKDKPDFSAQDTNTSNQSLANSGSKDSQDSGMDDTDKGTEE